MLKATANADAPVYHWENSAWVKKQGAGTAIAVAPGGTPWLVNSAGDIYYWDGSKFLINPTGGGCAVAIGVGQNAFGTTHGDPWIIGCNGEIFQMQGN